MTFRRLGFLAAMLVTLLAAVAQATFIPTCTITKDWITVNGPYQVTGKCTFPTSYTTGGMPLADPNAVTANTLRLSGNKLMCNSVARFPLVILFEPFVSTSSTLGTVLFDFDPNGRILAGSDPNGQVPSGTNLSTATTNFYAVCK